MVVSTSRTKQCAQVSASFVSLLDESDELLVREENFARIGVFCYLDVGCPLYRGQFQYKSTIGSQKCCPL